MELPLPFEAPLTLAGALTIHEKLVPETFEESVKFVCVFAQIVSEGGEEEITTSGFTVTV